jgi:hypothetical protein
LQVPDVDRILLSMSMLLEHLMDKHVYEFDIFTCHHLPCTQTVTMEVGETTPRAGEGEKWCDRSTNRTPVFSTAHTTYRCPAMRCDGDAPARISTPCGTIHSDRPTELEDRPTDRPTDRPIVLKKD